jgi:hypothetical protein
MIHQEIKCAKYKGRRTEAALDSEVLSKSYLYGMQLIAPADAFDCHYGRAIQLTREQQAGTHCDPIDEHGAHPAHPMLASDMRTR